jgi:phosphatidate cytidylyltransferase
MTGSREGWLVFFGVIGVLLVASLIGFILSRRIRDEAGRRVVDNLNRRIKAWWIMALVVSAALMAGPRAVIVLFAFVSFAALREFMTLTPTQRGDHDSLSLSFFGVLPFQYVLVWIHWYGLFTIFIPVYAFLILPAMTVVSGDTKDFLARTSQTQWGLMICVYCISHVPAMLMLRIPHFDPAMLVIFLIVVVQASDVLQYIWGKLLGRRKIAPAVSPSKTVEGFAGGILTATGLGAALWWLTPYNIWQAAAISLLITFMGFLGGLVMSAIKRDRGVKDWGHIIEGHGGMLDRLDSLCFAAPIFFHLTRYFFT